jgi:tRNA(Ile)-lysidine synthase
MTRFPPVVRKVEDWLRRHQVEPDNIVVAVSGGPDSVCLLHALVALQKATAKRSLCVAHFNHLLRGRDSDADAEFVRHLHEELVAQHPEIHLCMGQADVALFAEAEGANTEGMARQLRYAWLAEVAQEMKARWIATGHTADDQAETVLHRLLRGTGIQGLRGIASRRTLEPGIEVIRPLLNVTRPEVIHYLSELQQPYRIDESNLDTGFTRNRIRHDLLPLLNKEYNPSIASVLGRLAEQADELFSDMADRAAELLRCAEQPRAGGMMILDRSRLSEVPRFLVREMLRLLWARENWPMNAMDFAAWERVADIALGKASAVDLPSGVKVRLQERVVQLERRQ